MREVMFATRIEASCRTVRLPDGRTMRVDQYVKTCHDERWRDDFRLRRALGVAYLRRARRTTSPTSGRGGTTGASRTRPRGALRDLGVAPIADLCHLGVPSWVGDCQIPDWFGYFAEYARAFAGRFPLVRLYTPVNRSSAAPRSPRSTASGTSA